MPPNPRNQGETESALLKFLIGFFATVCAIVVPRFGPLLASKDATDIAMPSMPFIVASLAFAAIIGGIVVIAEFRTPRVPWETFLRALGVPALIAGGVTAAATSSTVAVDEKNRSALIDAAVAGSSIPKRDQIITLTPIAPAGSPGSSLDILVPVSSAYAQGVIQSPARSVWSDFSTVRPREPEYAVIIRRTANQEEALRAAEKFKVNLPDAQAVQTPQGFGVISGVKPESAAVLEAIEIKKKTGLTPELVRVK